MLKINEIFFSIQGESLFVGKPTVFVRCTGCNLRCTWCDTEYAFYEGRAMSLDQIVTEILQYQSEYVCITGGEPLLQAECIPLMERLLQLGLSVSVETGGGVSIDSVPPQVTKVVDIKCPDSGESGRMVWDNVDKVFAHDQFKFVIASKTDFDWAQETNSRLKLSDRCTVLYSPVHGKVEPRSLATWILEAKAPVTLQLQMHKAIWGAEARGV